MIQSLSVRRGAAGDDFTDSRDQAIEHEADDADIEQRQDDLADMRGIPRVPDEEADADAADQHLGGDDGEPGQADADARSEEHTSELQSRLHLVCRLLLEKKKKKKTNIKKKTYIPK